MNGLRMLKASPGMKERGEHESFALAESAKHDHYLRRATGEAAFIAILAVCVCVFLGRVWGGWRSNMYINLSHLVAQTVALDFVFFSPVFCDTYMCWDTVYSYNPHQFLFLFRENMVGRP